MSAPVTRSTTLALALAALGFLPACSILQEAPGEQGADWVETQVSLPAYPSDSDLMAVDIGRPGDAFRYLIDPRSLAVGGDGVTRYTVVLVSHGGGNNVLYEGIRCQTNSAKRYAFGTDGAFAPVQSADWELMTQGGPRAYQFILARGYLCTRRNVPYDTATALSRLRHGGAPGFRDPDMGVYRW
jgi:hypothetical protein